MPFSVESGRTWARRFGLLLVVLLLSACASAPGANPRDPLEPFNRSVYRFNDALDAMPKETRNAPSRTREGLAFCNRLFDIEKGIVDADDATRLAARQELCPPILDEFHAWLRKTRPSG